MLEEYVGTTRPVVREREGLGSSATKCMVEDTKYMQLVRMLRSWMMSSILSFQKIFTTTKKYFDEFNDIVLPFHEYAHV